MTNFIIDTSTIGTDLKLRLSTDSKLPTNKYEILTLIDYQHIPPYLITTKSIKININNDEENIIKEEINKEVEFIETIFKASFLTNKIISLLLSCNELPNMLSIMYPDFNNKLNESYTLKMVFINLSDNYIMNIMYPEKVFEMDAIDEGVEYKGEEGNSFDSNEQHQQQQQQSKLARSLNAHIIRRGFTRSSTNTSSNTSSNSSNINTPMIKQSTTTTSSSSITATTTSSFKSDTFISSLERIVKGEFRMRRLDSKFDQLTLRRFEKLLIRSVMFKFRNRTGIREIRESSNSSSSSSSSNKESSLPPAVKVKVSVSEIEEVLGEMIPILL